MWSADCLERSPDRHIQATGRDARGRKQSVRKHVEIVGSRVVSRFRGKSGLPLFRERVEADLSRAGVQKTVAALLARRPKRAVRRAA